MAMGRTNLLYGQLSMYIQWDTRFKSPSKQAGVTALASEPFVSPFKQRFDVIPG